MGAWREGEVKERQAHKPAKSRSELASSKMSPQILGLKYLRATKGAVVALHAQLGNEAAVTEMECLPLL